MGERVLTREESRTFIRSTTDKLKLPSDYTAIGEGALAGFSQLKELIIPETIKKVAPHAFFVRTFKNKSELERLTITSSATQFDLWSFFDCNKLKNIYLPEDFPERAAVELFFFVPEAKVNFGRKMMFPVRTKTIQQMLDETPDILTSGVAMHLPISDGTLTIPSKYFAIAPRAFSLLKNKGIKRVAIPSSIRICAKTVFADLPELEEVVIESGTVSLDNYMFEKCSRLKRVGIPNSVARVGAGLLMDCTSLRGIRLPQNLTSVSEEMFSGCSSLVVVDFNDKIKRIGAGAFNACKSLQTMELPESVENIGISAFWDCSSLQQLYIPPSVKTISQSALGNCPSLSLVYMPKIITDALESKRIFGENTNPNIQWIESSVEHPVFSSEVSAVPALPMASEPEKQITAQELAQPQTSQTQQHPNAMQMEEALAQMQQQIAALTKQTAAMQQSNQGQPVLDAAAIQSLNENLSAMREQFQGVVGMQNRVEEIATMQANVQQKIDSISDIQQSAEAITGMKDKIEAISDIQEKVNAMSGMQEKVEAISDIQQKVDAMSGMQTNAEALSDIQQKVEAISDIQQKVDAMSGMQEQVAAISDIQEKVSNLSENQANAEALSSIQEKVEAISDIQQKVDAISDIQEKVGAISDVKEKVGEISDSQADINKKFSEIASRPAEDPATEEEHYEFDARMALVSVQRSHYRSDDRVFTHEISKSIAGPKERTAELKQYTVIASRAFLETEAGERFQIPEGIRRIETQGFWSCPRLTALELPNSLTEVEPDAFSGCSRLSDVYLPEGFPERRAAEYFMFRPEIRLIWPKKGFLSKPKTMTVAEILERYDDILTAEKVSKFQVSGHILRIPEGYTIIAPDTAKGINVRADEPEHTLQTIFLPRSVRRVASRAFTGLETVMHIVIPNGLQIIDMNAFMGCVGPYRLVLPDTVIYIGPFAFSAPSHYEQIRLPKKIRYISENAFANCDTLASLRFATSVKFIGESALSGCNSLNTLTIPKRFAEELPTIINGPVKINVRWTEDCRAEYTQEPNAEFMAIAAPDFPPTAPQRLFTLEMSKNTDNFAEKLTKLYQHPCVGPYALLEMANQTKFEIPLGVQRICSNAFGNNSRLLTLTIPKALNEFEYEAFKGCDRLRDIFVPDEFDRYGAGVLFMRKPVLQVTFGNARPVRVRQLIQECPWILTSADAAELDAVDGTLTVPNGYIVISSYVYHGVMGHTNLKRILIPPSARLIGTHAFVHLNALEEVICAEGLQGIESETFEECAELKRIVLPSTLRYLGENPFVGCPKLETLVIPKAFADRVDQLRINNPNLVVQWCEDFAESERPSLLAAYQEMMESAENINPELMETVDPFGVPFRHEQDSDFETPIEASVMDENAIEGEVYEQITTEDIPLLPNEGTIELPLNEKKAPQEEEPQMSAEELENVIANIADTIFADDSVQETAKLDGAAAEDLINDTAEAIAEDLADERSIDELDSLDENPAEETDEDNEEPIVATEDWFSGIEELGEAVAEEASKTEETLDDIAESAEESLPSIDEIGEAIEDAVPDVEKTLDEIAESAEESLPSIDEIGEAVEDAVLDVENALDETAESAEESLPSIDEIGEAVENAVPDVENALDEIAESAKESLPSIDEIGEAVEDAVPDVENVLDEIAESAEESLPSIDEIGEAVEDAVPDVENALDDIAESTEESLLSIDEIGEAVEEEVSDVENAPDDITDETMEALPTIDDILIPESDENAEESEINSEDLLEDMLPNLEDMATPAEKELSELEQADAEFLAAVKDFLPSLELPTVESAADEKTASDTPSIETAQDIDDSFEAMTDELSEEAESVEESTEESLQNFEEIFARDSEEISEIQDETSETAVEALPSIDEIVTPVAEETPEAEESTPSIDEVVVPAAEVTPETEESIPSIDAIAALVPEEEEEFPDVLAPIGPTGDIGEHINTFNRAVDTNGILDDINETNPTASVGLDLPALGNISNVDDSLFEKTDTRNGALQEINQSFDDTTAVTADPEPVSETERLETMEAIADSLFEGSVNVAELIAEERVEVKGIPEDGRFTAKERRRWYHGEFVFVMPNGYREIRSGACAGQDKLETLEISDTVEKIGNGAFSDCSSLVNVTIPLSVQEIAEDAFDCCDAIRRVTIPHRFEDVVMKLFPIEAAFKWLEDPIKIIGDGRFTAKIRAKVYDDGAVLTIPEGYTEIRAGACASLEDMTELKLPDTLQKICAGAFSDCDGLTEVTIPKNVTELSEDAFDGCDNIQKVTIPRHLEEQAKVCFPNVILSFMEE